MATRAEINEKYGIVRLMPPDVANEQLSEEDVVMYEKMVQVSMRVFNEFEDED